MPRYVEKGAIKCSPGCDKFICKVDCEGRESSSGAVEVGNYELVKVHPDMIRITHKLTYDAVTVDYSDFQAAMNALIFVKQAEGV